MARKWVDVTDVQDPSPEEGYIREEEAVELLGLQKGKDFDWFDFDYIHTLQTGKTGNWVKLLPAVAARLKLTGPSVDDKPPAAPNRKSKIKNQKSESVPPSSINDLPERLHDRGQVILRPYNFGRGGMTCHEVADYLGLSLSQVYHLAYIRFNSFNRDNRRWIPIDEVENYAYLRQMHRERKGRWTDAGPQWKKGTEPPPKPAPVYEVGEPIGADIWIGVDTAAELLNYSEAYVYRLARQGRLPYRDHDCKREFNLAEVLKFQMRRDKERSKRDIPVGEWKRNTRIPQFRRWGDFPPNDRLITLKEAARILGVSPSTVRERFYVGRLFVWQREPKRGIPWYFSENQIRSYAEHPLRLHRRARFLASQQPNNPTTQRPNAQDWLEDHNLLDHEPTGSRDYGQFYTTGQAARILGVSVGTINMMRRRRRLIATRKDPDNPRSYWFFRKEDVHALIHDEGRRKKREQYRRAHSPEGKAARAEKELHEFFKEHEYIPHDPLNNAYRSTEALLNDRIHDFERLPLPDW